MLDYRIYKRKYLNKEVYKFIDRGGLTNMWKSKRYSDKFDMKYMILSSFFIVLTSLHTILNKLKPLKKIQNKGFYLVKTKDDLVLKHLIKKTPAFWIIKQNVFNKKSFFLRNYSFNIMRNYEEFAFV